MEIQKLQIKLMRKSGHIKTKESYTALSQQKVLPYLSIVQSVHGSYDIQLGRGSRESTGDGGFFIAPANVLQTIRHNLNPESGIMKNRWLFIDLVINGKFRPDVLFDFPTILPKELQPEMNALFDRLFGTDNIFDQYSVCYQIMKLLISVGKPKESVHDKTLQNVISYITQNYNSPLTIADLSQVAHMSQSNLHAVFKKQLGISPISYINHYRIAIATDELTETDFPIGDIAKSVGIPDQFYFSKLFKKTHGISPRAYRERK